MAPPHVANRKGERKREGEKERKVRGMNALYRTVHEGSEKEWGRSPRVSSETLNLAYYHFILSQYLYILSILSRSRFIFAWPRLRRFPTRPNLEKSLPSSLSVCLFLLALSRFPDQKVLYTELIVEASYLSKLHIYPLKLIRLDNYPFLV